MVRTCIRSLHVVRRSPQHQAAIVVLIGLVVLGAAYLKIAPPQDSTEIARATVANRVLIIGAGLAALIAIWTVVNQWAISRRQLTIQVLRELETDKEYGEALIRFNAIAKRETTLRIYAKGLPEELKKPPSSTGDEDADATAMADYEVKLAAWRADDAAIALVLNQDELLAIGIRNSILDYRLICAYWRTTLIRRHSSAKEFIEELRHQTRTPTMYIEMERFAEQLKKDYYHGLL